MGSPWMLTSGNGLGKSMENRSISFIANASESLGTTHKILETHLLQRVLIRVEQASRQVHKKR
jgi:hypothetical protein